MNEMVQRACERADTMIEMADANDKETRLRDTLADLRHWAEANEVDFHVAVDASYETYLVERNEAAV